MQTDTQILSDQVTFGNQKVDKDSAMVEVLANKNGGFAPSENVHVVYTGRAKGEFLVVQGGSQNKVLASGVHHGEDKDLKFQFFEGKGGNAAIVTTPTNRYVVMPGSRFEKDRNWIELSGERPSLAPPPNVTLPKPTPKQDITNVGMLLGAGLSTRYEPSPKVFNVAKPASLISPDDSFISRLAKQFKANGIDNVLVNTYFKPETTRATLDKAAKKDNINIQYVAEEANGKPSGSAGGLALALNDPKLSKHFEGKHVVVSAGDSILEADISDLVRKHVANNAAFTIGAFKANDNALDKYGIIVTEHGDNHNQSGEIKEFVEKPALTPHGLDRIGRSRLMNPSLYVISPEVLPIIKNIFNDPKFQERQKGKNVMNPGADWAMDILPRVMAATQEGKLTRDGKPLTFRAEELSGHWRDVGNMAEYFRSLDDLYGGLFGEKPKNDGFYHDGIAYWDKQALDNLKNENVKLIGNAIVASHDINES